MTAPVGIPVQSGSGNVANAAAVATMPAVLNSTNYISGFEMTAAGATAGAVVVATVTGVLGGALSYIFTVPAGAALGAVPLIVEFSPSLPASGTNTAIVVTLPALGAGNTNAASTVHGFRI